MNLDLVGPRAQLTPDTVLANRVIITWQLMLGVVLVLGSTVILEIVLPPAGLPRFLWGSVLGIAAPFGALLACVLAARVAVRGARSVWISFATGSCALLSVRILESMGYPGLAGSAAAALITAAGTVFFHLSLAAGAALALQRSLPQSRRLDALVDAALILAGAVLLLERFSFPLLREGWAAGGAAAWAGPGSILAALASFFFSTLLALRPDSRLPRFVPPLLLLAVGSLLLGSARDVTRMLDPSELGGVATYAGTMLLALTGFAAARRLHIGAADTVSVPWNEYRIQRLAVPLAALLPGAVAVDAAFRSGLTVELGISCALLGLLLAIRIRRTIQTGAEHAEIQQLLAQNSALVEVSRALADATDLNRTLDLIARWACQLLDAPAAGVELLDTEQDELEIRALHGLPSHLLGLRTPVESTLTGSVVRSGRAAAVSHLGSGVYQLSDRLDAFGTFPTAAASLHYRDQRLGALFAIRFDRTFDAADLELLGALADQASLAIRNAQLFDQVRALSLTDPLTGLANRRQLARDLSREFAAAVRGRQLIAVIFDLDNFKEYNDRYGHPAGDEVLRLFGQALAAETRAMNLAARYGGDEFVALLADTSLEGTEVFIERVANRFREGMAQFGRTPITISAGYAEYTPGIKSPGDLIAAADKALYRVKPSRASRGNP
jgi:diguanylate cyclase (GGDEF)-like protein